MSGWFSSFAGTKFWSFLRSKIPKKYQDDLERALKKGHEVVESENKKADTVQNAKEVVKNAAWKQAEKERRVYNQGFGKR